MLFFEFALSDEFFSLTLHPNNEFERNARRESLKNCVS